jgi:hypothetical protein
MNYEQNAANFATKHGIKLIINSSEYRPYFADDKESRFVFNCTLTRNKKRYTFTFGQSISSGGEEPTMYDILSCLQKYEVGTFNDFCGEFGYNEDDTTSKRTYKAVCKEYNAVLRLFGDILDELQEIQ